MNKAFPLFLKPLFNFSLFFSFITIVLFSLFEFKFSIILFFLLFGLIGIFISNFINPKSNYLFIIVYTISVIFSVLLYFNFQSIYGVPYWSGGSDELEYERLGKLFAENFNLFDYAAIREYLVPVWHNSVGYIYTVGFFTKISLHIDGPHTMHFRLFNSCLLGLISVLVYGIGESLGLKKNTIIYSSLFASLMPLMLWTAAQTLRDLLISFLLIFGTFLWTPKNFNDKPRISKFYIIPISFLIILFLFELRKGQAIVLLITSTVSLIYGFNKDYKFIKILWIIFLFFTVLFLVFKYSELIFSDISLLFLSSESYSEYRIEETGGGLSSFIFNSKFPLSLIFRPTYALISPLPVISSKFYQIWLSLGTILQIFFLPYFLNGIYLSFEQKRWRMLLLTFILLFIGMSMFTFTIRHIVQYLPFGVLITAFGFENYSKSKKSIFYYMLCILIIFSTVYLFFKFI